MSLKTFDIICPYCGEVADVMSYRRIEKNTLKIIYICPYCGNGGEEKAFLYE